jgi:2-succinyl-5-enolpyruvyl-6-hydroxy-3-cyclohexene-1-carboxylate synthase
MNAPNRNLLWAKVFVDELARSGLRAVCIAPGSRSTPLAIAFAEQPGIKVYSLIDERSCAFFALGLALAGGQPAAMLCSSGTATANFYPAIIEAHYAGVPLIVLTADRPHELRESGANQTVDQVKMYGEHVLWSVDMALPEAQPPALALRNLRTLADRACATANGLMGATVKGAVHLNFPFRKPLEPTPVESDFTEFHDERQPNVPFTRIWRGRMRPPDGMIDWLEAEIRQSARGLIVCGPRCPGGDFPAALARLAKVTGYPVIADATSGIRFGHRDEGEGANFMGGYDSFLRGTKEWQSPDIVLHFGAMPTSQAVDDYLTAIAPNQRVWISHDGVWKDANHLANEFLWADAALLCEALAERLTLQPPSPDESWTALFRHAETETWNTIGESLGEDYFDGAVLADVVDLLPDPSKLFIASSLPVRHLDQFGRPNAKHINVYANRGASGIDGTISSALGAAAADPDVPLTLVLGDLAFYHDMNGLLAVKRCGIKATIVVINNDGGGIFYRLPIARYDPPFTDLFATPHGLSFESAAQLYGLDYTAAQDRESFRSAYRASQMSENATIIEVPTNAEHDLARRNAIVQRVLERMKTATFLG